MRGILGKKLGMAQIFDEGGTVVPVTVIEAGPCPVIQVKLREKDGYSAVQLGFGERKKITKTMEGHFKKANIAPRAIVKEFPVSQDDEVKTGDEVRVDIFSQGEKVNVTGISKGKGTSGVVKRHGFAGGPKTHGQTDRHRRGGSVGSTSTPGRVFKGKRMAGHHGSMRVTVRNLEVVKVDKEKNILIVKGAVPGANRGYLLISKV